MEDVQIQIPVAEITERLGHNAPAVYWSFTYWFCRQLKHRPRPMDWYETPSIYVSNADEVNKSAFYRSMTYTLLATNSWIDVALQVLERIG